MRRVRLAGAELEEVAGEGDGSIACVQGRHLFHFFLFSSGEEELENRKGRGFISFSLLNFIESFGRI